MKKETYCVDLSSRQRAAFGVYVHVPFCPHLCPYCDFVKTTRFSRRDVNAHFAALQTQLSALLPLTGLHGGEPITVYFGGGTPGLFHGSFFEPLLTLLKSRFHVTECTIEANPHMLSRLRAESWIKAGINRVTLGVQSLDSRVLAFLGRRHQARDVLHSIDLLREVGFSNIQTDLIYGLPAELNSRDLAKEVATLAAAGATGVSGYALTVEGATAFAQMGVSPCDESALSDYNSLKRACAAVGWQRRETSNFSATETEHNNLYWYGHYYLGLGTGSHGFLARYPDGADLPFGCRYTIGRAEREQRAPGNDRLELLGECAEDLRINWDAPRTRSQMRREMVYTLLRTPNGVPGCFLRQASDMNAEDRLSRHPRVARGVDEGRLIRTAEGGIKLAEDEFLLGDLWCREILQALGWDHEGPP